MAEDLCSLPGPSFRSFVDNFCARQNKTVSKAFRAGSIAFGFNANATSDGITLRFSERFASDASYTSTKDGHPVYSPVDSDTIEL